jgi:hypothetical protein
MPNGKINPKALDKKVTSISNALAKLSSAADFRKLILEWRRPGWTTPAEFLLVSGILDSMEAQIDALVTLKANLIKGAQAVSRGYQPTILATRRFRQRRRVALISTP